MIVTYRAAPGSHIRDNDAGVIASFLDKKFGDDPRTPADVVRAARPISSPIHGHFEWDDAAAGGAYRLEQARHMLRSIEVVYANGEEREPSRAYHRVVLLTEDGAQQAYVPERVVWESPDLAAQVVDKAKRELAGWAARYRNYQELSDLVAAVEEVLAT